MLKPPKANVDDHLVTESYQFREQMIHKIHAAMEAPVIGAEILSKTKRRRLQASQN
jgi:hypothetical protein